MLWCTSITRRRQLTQVDGRGGTFADVLCDAVRSAVGLVMGLGAIENMVVAVEGVG
jgi:hypothetical protein